MIHLPVLVEQQSSNAPAYYSILCILESLFDVVVRHVSPFTLMRNHTATDFTHGTPNERFIANGFLVFSSPSQHLRPFFSDSRLRLNLKPYIAMSNYWGKKKNFVTTPL